MGIWQTTERYGMSRKGRWATLGVVAMGLTLGLAAPASAKPDPAIPLDCSVSVEGYRGNGAATRIYQYTGGDILVTPWWERERMPFTPVALQNLGGAGDPGQYMSSDIVVADDGTVYDRSRTGTLRDNGRWKRTATYEVNRTGWTGTTGLAFAWPHIYRFTETGGFRYDILTGSPSTLSNEIALPATVAEYRSLVYSYAATAGTTPDGSARTWDVLVGVSGDRLVEVRIAQDDPSVMTETTLVDSGFAPVHTISTGWCQTNQDGTAIMAIEDRGKTRVYYDPDYDDGDGSDIVGGDVVVTWRFKGATFGQ